MPTTSPSMDIQVSSNFERLLFDAYGRDREPVRALMALARAVAPVHVSPTRARRACARCSPPTAPTRTRPPPTIRTALRETGYLIDPHTAVGVAVAEKETRDPAVPMVVLVDRPSGEIPRCRRGRLRRPPARCRTGSPTSTSGRSASPCCRPTRRAVERHHSGRQPRRARRSCRMSVEVTRLASGLRRRHRRDAASARPPRSACGSAPAAATSAPDEHGISHLPRAHGVQGHRRGAPRARSPRRSRRSAAISTPRPASRRPPITRACSRPTCRSRSTCCPTSSPTRRSIPRSCSASRTSSCRRSAPPRTRPTISSSSICRRPPSRTSRSAARSSARRRPCARSTRKRLAAYLARNYRAPDMVVAAAGAVDHARSSPRSSARFAELRRAGGAGRRSRRASSAASRIETRDLEQVHVALALRGRAAARSLALQPAGLHQRARRRHVVAPVPGGAREFAGFAIRSMRSTRPMPTPACSASMPAPTPPTRRS